MITVRYFASLRETLGTSFEELPFDSKAIKSVADLQSFLLSIHGEAWAALQNSSTRIAVNRVMADSAAAIKDGDEVAFFPPVTGG